MRFRVRFSSLVAALMLVPGCGNAATPSIPFSNYPIDLPLVANQEIGFHGARDTIVVGSGETAHFTWADGKLYMNGVVIRPLQPFANEVASLEVLQQLYGEVPRIQELVEASSVPDAHERWHRAYFQWQQEKFDLVLSAGRQYAFAVTTRSVSVSNAAQASLTILLGGVDLVDSARVNLSEDPESKACGIEVWWTGQPVSSIISLVPDFHRFEQAVEGFYAADRGLELIKQISLSTSDGLPVKIELGFGICVDGFAGSVRRTGGK